MLGIPVLSQFPQNKLIILLNQYIHAGAFYGETNREFLISEIGICEVLNLHVIHATVSSQSPGNPTELTADDAFKDILHATSTDIQLIAAIDQKTLQRIVQRDSHLFDEMIKLPSGERRDIMLKLWRRSNHTLKGLIKLKASFTYVISTVNAVEAHSNIDDLPTQVARDPLETHIYKRIRIINYLKANYVGEFYEAGGRVMPGTQNCLETMLSNMPKNCHCLITANQHSILILRDGSGVYRLYDSNKVPIGLPSASISATELIPSIRFALSLSKYSPDKSVVAFQEIRNTSIQISNPDWLKGINFHKELLVKINNYEITIHAVLEEAFCCGDHETIQHLFDEKNRRKYFLPGDATEVGSLLYELKAFKSNIQLILSFAIKCKQPEMILTLLELRDKYSEGSPYIFKFDGYVAHNCISLALELGDVSLFLYCCRNTAPFVMSHHIENAIDECRAKGYSAGMKMLINLPLTAISRVDYSSFHPHLKQKLADLAEQIRVEQRRDETDKETESKTQYERKQSDEQPFNFSNPLHKHIFPPPNPPALRQMLADDGARNLMYLHVCDDLNDMPPMRLALREWANNARYANAYAEVMDCLLNQCNPLQESLLFEYEDKKNIFHELIRLPPSPETHALIQRVLHELPIPNCIMQYRDEDSPFSIALKTGNIRFIAMLLDHYPSLDVKNFGYTTMELVADIKASPSLKGEANEKLRAELIELLKQRAKDKLKQQYGVKDPVKFEDLEIREEPRFGPS